MSSSDMWVFSIGADVPLGRGILKCDGAVLPDGRVMGAIQSRRAFTVLNFAPPHNHTSMKGNRRSIFLVSLQHLLQ